MDGKSRIHIASKLSINIKIIIDNTCGVFFVYILVSRFIRQKDGESPMGSFIVRSFNDVRIRDFKTISVNNFPLVFSRRSWVTHAFRVRCPRFLRFYRVCNVLVTAYRL